MAKESKIKTLGLYDRCLALYAQGRSELQISEILTEECDGDESVSESCVHRFLKAVRKARKDFARQAVQDHVNQHMESDLEQLETLEEYWVDEMFAKDKDGKYIHDLRGQNTCSIRIENIIQMKVRFAAELGAGKKLTEAGDPVDLNKYRGKKKEASNA